MRRLMLLVFFVLALILYSGVDSSTGLTQSTQQPGSEIQILSPLPGQALQGNVPVVVNTTTTDFKSVELTFCYFDDPSGTWFLIYQGIQPVTGTMLVLWDTSTITDGDYTLRMVVSFLDNSQKIVLVPGIRVRNYTPVETSTPEPVQPTRTSAPINTATLIPTHASKIEQSPQASPVNQTQIPLNPVEVSQTDIYSSIGKGMLAVIGLFCLGLIYNAARTLRRR
jgi:hypothetical protein